jgi:acetyl esterase/lipase
MDLKLDLYRPIDIGLGAVPVLSPGVVVIHGGSFINGDKADLAPVGELYASYGFTVASIQYRLAGDSVPFTPGPASSFPFPLNLVSSTINAGVQDATTAMTWMRTNAAQYGIDPAHVALGGGSAGAIISLLQAYHNPPASAAPQVVVSFLGAMFGTEQSIQAGDPPAFVVASSDDDIVHFNPPLGTVAAVDQMDQVGVYNEFYVQTGVGHDVDFEAEFDGKPLAEHNLEFLAKFLTVPGDYNGDTEVDASDYVVWRNGLGTQFTPDDYVVWRASFGRTTPTGASTSALGEVATTVWAVPEPATHLPLTLAALFAFAHRRNRLHRQDKRLSGSDDSFAIHPL